MGDHGLPPGPMGLLPVPLWGLFIGNLGAREREYLAPLLQALSASYSRLVEPAAGTFAVATIARHRGWQGAVIEASDVSLYSAVLGEAVCGRDLNALEVKLDGEPLNLPGAPARQAAEVLLTQVRLRNAKRKQGFYLQSVMEDLEENAAAHLDELQAKIEALAAHLGPIQYRSVDMFEHLAEVFDDPGTVVVLNPPTYTKGYERFFDTDGRLTWNEPRYRLFDPAAGVADIMESVVDAKALVVCLQQAPNGHPAVPPVGAHASTPGETVYYLANRPEEILAITGLVARPRPAATGKTKLPGPVMPPDHPITAESECGIIPISSSQAHHLKQLWVHRIKPGSAALDMAVVIDGHLAAIAGYDVRNQPLSPWAFHVLLLYTFATPHPYRLLRLLTAIACQRSTLDTLRGPTAALWVDSCHSVMTVMLSPHPESKAQRGLMTLIERRPDPVHGYRLYYSAPMGLLSTQEAFDAWFKKELQWQSNRAVSK